VSDGWQFVLNETSVHFLLALNARHRQNLILVLEELALDPMAKGDFEAKDSVSRPIQVKVAGQFLISYWPDAFVKELRVINLEWI
jgi:hypothetical protein